jgi:hypothetical protein
VAFLSKRTFKLCWGQEVRLTWGGWRWPTALLFLPKRASGPYSVNFVAHRLCNWAMFWKFCSSQYQHENISASCIILLSWAAFRFLRFMFYSVITKCLKTRTMFHVTNFTKVQQQNPNNQFSTKQMYIQHNTTWQTSLQYKNKILIATSQLCKCTYNKTRWDTRQVRNTTFPRYH